MRRSDKMRIDKRMLLVLAVVSALVLAIIACDGGPGEVAPATEVPTEPPAEATEPPAVAPSEGGLDWTLSPDFGDLELETGFIPDPYEFRVLAGGTVQAIDTADGCCGLAGPNPDLNFYWTGGGGSLRIFFVPDEDGADTTLIINDASANWLCNDDAYGLNPAIDIEPAASGWYSIWVGSYFGGEVVPGTLYFTEMDITPDDITGGGGAVAPAEGEISQWAISATASTEYGSDNWSAMQATGAPDTFDCGDYTTAWATATSDEVAWLRLTYATPVVPSEINIHESYNPDAVTMVEVVDLDGESHTVYEGTPSIESACPGVLTITITGAGAPVDTVIVHIDESVFSEWNEIDAVELVGTAG
jgi:hypothetical protein